MSIKTILIKNTTINSLGHLYLTFASFFSLPFTLKYLGSEQFALLVLITTVVNLISVFNCGLFQATIRYLNISLPSLQKLKRYLSAAFIFTSLLALLWFVLGFGLLPYLKNRFQFSSQLIILVIFLALLNLFTNFFNSLPQARHHFTFYNLKTLFVGSANTWLTAYLALLYHSLLPILFIRLIAQLITLISELIYHFHFFNSFCIFSFSQLKSPLHSLFAFTPTSNL